MAGNQKAMFALLRAGLWEQDVALSSFEPIDFNEIYHLAEKEAVVGLVAAGLEHVLDEKIPQMTALTFAGTAIRQEQRNKAINQFIADTVEKMRDFGINTLLVKGQGIGQCYERPLWRPSGDVDFLLSEDNYKMAKDFCGLLASKEKPERSYSKEKGYYIDQWLVELHGTLRTGLSSKVDREIDTVQKDVFNVGKVRTWMNCQVQVLLPAVDEDVFLVFTHFVKHFYKEGGVSLRQMCDWCRLLWTFRAEVDDELIERRLRRAGLVSEWRAFAAVAVEWLGMPIEAMPLYSADARWSRKALRIVDFVLGEREWHKWHDTFVVARIFLWNTLRFLPGIMLNVNLLKFKERVFGT